MPRVHAKADHTEGGAVYAGANGKFYDLDENGDYGRAVVPPPSTARRLSDLANVPTINRQTSSLRHIPLSVALCLTGWCNSLRTEHIPVARHSQPPQLLSTLFADHQCSSKHRPQDTLFGSALWPVAWTTPAGVAT